MSLLVNETYTVIELKDVPDNVRIISTCWVFNVKPAADGSIAVFKARIVARGCLAKPGVHYGSHYDKTFAPVAQAVTIRLLLAIACSRDLHIRSVDFVTAFLHAKRLKTDKPVYVWPPKGLPDYKRGLV